MQHSNATIEKTQTDNIMNEFGEDENNTENGARLSVDGEEVDGVSAERSDKQCEPEDGNVDKSSIGSSPIMLIQGEEVLSASGERNGGRCDYSTEKEDETATKESQMVDAIKKSCIATSVEQTESTSSKPPSDASVGECIGTTEGSGTSLYVETSTSSTCYVKKTEAIELEMIGRADSPEIIVMRKDPVEDHVLIESYSDSTSIRKGTIASTDEIIRKGTHSNLSPSDSRDVCPSSDPSPNLSRRISMPGAYAIENPMFTSPIRQSILEHQQTSSSIQSGFYSHSLEVSHSNSVVAATPQSHIIHDDPEAGHHAVVEAICVDENEVLEAKVLGNDGRSYCKRSWLYYAFASVVFLAVLSTFSVVITKKQALVGTNEYEKEKYFGDTDRREVIREILSPLSGENVFDENSPDFSPPRHDALEWVLRFGDHPADWKIRQRYVLALFYFSTNGSSWDDTLTFLSGRDECAWSWVKTRDIDILDFVVKGVVCNTLGKVETIQMDWNNLSGTIPHEISYFSDSLKDFSIGGGSLSGSIPSSFGSLTNLEILGLNDNCFSGRLPDFSRLSKIEELSLQNNANLSGSLNGFCTGLTYTNPRTTMIRSDCDRQEDESTSMIECDCCVCCSENDCPRMHNGTSPRLCHP